MHNWHAEGEFDALITHLVIKLVKILRFSSYNYKLYILIQYE